MEIFYEVFRYAFLIAMPLMVVALGGMFSERSGTINIALDGIMIIGTFCGYMFIYLMQKAGVVMNPQLLLIFAILIAGIAGTIYSLLLGVSAINFKADQTIGGTALNIISVALVVFLARMTIGTQNIQIDTVGLFYIKDGGFLGSIPVIGDMFFKDTYITTFIGLLILLVSTFLLNKTRFGLRLRSCGEHPQAADSVGINVPRMRYWGVAISGLLGGIGGMLFMVPLISEFSGTVFGYGFLALAVLIFGQWKPSKIFLGALFFAFMMSLSSLHGKIPFLDNLGIPSAIYDMVPYFATLVVLAFTSKKSRAPKAEGIPYDKALR
ncbi:MAG: ABC transporter permease [Clostridia bacterium]